MKIKEFTFVHVMIAALLVGGAYLFVESKHNKEPLREPILSIEKDTKESSNSLKNEQLMNSTAAGEEVTTDGTNNNSKVFEILATGNNFLPQEISVTTGDLVRIIFQNNDGIHNFTIDEIGIKTAALVEGESLEFTFKAAYPGTYRYYCSKDVCIDNDVFGILLIQ